MTQRQGVLVHPYQRLRGNQLKALHKSSLEILRDPGLISYNQEAAEIFSENGAQVDLYESEGTWRIKIPSKLIEESIQKAPSIVKLGARRPENKLILNAEEPRVRFGSGSEANIWLEMDFEPYVSKNQPNKQINLPLFKRRQPTIEDLCKAARVAERLDNLDFFIRTVNIQDEDVTEENKDVNKFLASLNNTTKHVMAGLTEIGQLKNLVKMAQIIAGGREELLDNPIISFITCVTKSPLQFVEDTTQKLIEIVREGLPVVVSSSPQGGATAPIQESGMVAQINAEILAGITLAQLVKKGAPVLYGSVPGRARMDDLDNMYGVPEFSQYNIDCVQMARFYKIPCYSTAGVADIKVPGMQATLEKTFSHIMMGLSGAQYVHYAFGLLEKTNTFCLQQAILDDVHIGMVKHMLREPKIKGEDIKDSVEQIRKVMGTSHKLFARYARRSLRRGDIFVSYPFESKTDEDQVLLKAYEKTKELLSRPPQHMPQETLEKISNEVTGVLPKALS